MMTQNNVTQKTGWLLFKFFLIITASFLVSSPLPVFPQVQLAEPSEASPLSIIKNEKEQNVAIDFNNVDLPVFIKFISQLTGKNFVVDERVKGKVSIFSPGKISVKEAMAVFESVLEVHGYSTVSAGEIIKVVPSTDVRTKSIETKIKEDFTSSDDRVVTQIVPLRYADPEEIKRLLSPLISKNSVLLSYPPTNTLIITDVHSNIRRLLQIISAIDVTGIGREISVIPLKYSYAEKLVKVVESVFKSPVGPQKLTMERDVKLVADERTNSIIILASENDSIKIKNLIELLDKEVPRGKEKIHVYYLENAVAEEIAKVLQELPEKEEKPDPTKPLLPKKSPVVSDKVTITPDKATNSLIIRGDIDDFAALVDIIQKLDIPRSMVYIECLIMEVNVEKDFELGTEWSVFGGSLDDDGTFRGGGGGFSGGGFNKIPPLDPDTGIPTKPFPPGFTLGIFETIKIGNIYFPNIAALINAYKKEKDVHILSTPQILTTDNQEAKITIGKNIPYQTKEGTTSANETYSTYEYKDVGITLKITPHISKERLVRLNISKEISKLESSTDFRPTTLKRTIDTTVIVKDKNTVVIGGLIDEAFSKTEYRIPCLGDIPVAGWIFRNMAKENEKTNLFIFLTPHVVNTPSEAEQILNKKKEQFPRIEEGKIKMYNGNIPATGEPVKK